MTAPVEHEPFGTPALPQVVSTPRVSILMSFLNAEPFIREAVESVRAQTYSAWELLLVDDGSTDGSTRIAREYVHRFPDRMVYLEHPDHENLGISTSHNLSIRRARGEFLAILDADDVWLPNKLEEQVPLLDEHPEAGMLYGNSLFWRSWAAEPDGERPSDYLPPLGVPPDTLLAPGDLLARCLRGLAAVPCPCSVLLRRHVVERVGGFEEASERRVITDQAFSDQAFYAKMFVAAPVYVGGAVWDKYRLHPRSVIATAKRSGTLRDARGRYLDFVAGYLRQQGLAQGDLWRAVQWARRRHRHSRASALVSRARRAWGQARAGMSRLVPVRRRPQLRRLLHPPGGVRFGNLRRVTPLSRHFGTDRGQAVDRHYIEAFLAGRADDIRGHVLEIADDAYTRRFGGDRVTASDVLHVSEGNPNATIVDDLADGQHLSSDTYDCIIVTQTLHLIFDVQAAVRTLHRVLKPGGVVLVTAPGISQMHAGRWRDTWYWSFTPPSMGRLFGERFAPQEVQVCSYGNVLAACALLHGLAREELALRELDAHDPLYPVIVAVRARKPPPPPR